MKKKSLAFFILGIVFCSNNVRLNTLLFCIKSSSDNIIINSHNNNKHLTNNKDLNAIINSIEGCIIEPWLPGATSDDSSGDIYLNRIYRLNFTQRSLNQIDEIKNKIELMDIIHSVEYEYLRVPLYTPNDQYYNNQWFLPAINSNDAWNLWTDQGEIPGNKNVILASVDLGVNYEHADLRNNIWQNLGEDADGDGHTIEGSGSNWYLDPGDLNGIDDDDWDNNSYTYIDDLIGWDPAGLGGVDDNDPNPPSSWSHGTHVAGLLASTTDNNTGIASTAFNCSIMAVKVSDDNQIGGDVYITDGYAGILYAAKAGYYSEGFTIINNSWGGAGYSLYEQATINVCFNDYNAIIVCAAGNGSTTSWGESNESHYPSGYDNVVSVCALGNNNQWNHWATYGETVDLASPGENIRSTTNNGYASWDGSSMASPVAASVFGLLKSYRPSWTNEMIQTMVLGTADPIIYTVNSESYLQGMLGTGRVDAYYAINTPLFPDIEYIGDDILSGDDTIIEAGEQAEIFIILFSNPDWGSAINLQTNLTTESSHVTILNGNLNHADLPPGEALLSGPYIIEFSIDTPSSNIDFNLNLISNENDHVKYNKDIPLTYFVEESITLLGDLNQDSILSVLDLILLINIILGNEEPTSSQLLAGDLNQDSIINILDAIALVNIIIS